MRNDGATTQNGGGISHHSMIHGNLTKDGMETPIPTKERKKTEQKQSTIVPTLDCADESAALGVLEDDAEVGAPQHGGVAVDVVDGELDGGPGGPSDDGVEGEERADGDAGRARRRLQGGWQGGAEAEQPEEEEEEEEEESAGAGAGGGGPGRRHLLPLPCSGRGSSPSQEAAGDGDGDEGLWLSPQPAPGSDPDMATAETGRYDFGEERKKGTSEHRRRRDKRKLG